jgi:DNA helicase IV
VAHDDTAARLRDEIRAEQAHVDSAYARIDELTGRARTISAEVATQGKGITRQAALEREAAMLLTARRVQALRLGDHTALCFGRIDRTDGDRFYIGRFGVSDDADDPLVVDWRAPVAEPFYRATGLDPMGVTLRRHFISRGRTISGLDDEVLEATTTDTDRVVAGEGALLAALTRARTGRMGDIVGTIQAEQDAVIRAPLAGVLIVQGGPGTGKTAVALHRAAYLLYTHRFPLESAGVLFAGPNPTFLRYVEHVLPSLGEESVALATPAELFDGVVVTRGERRDVAAVKADVRMAEVVARAVRDRQRRLRSPAQIPVGAYSLELDVETSAKIVARARRSGGTHNARRALVERLTVTHLRAAYRRAVERDVRIGRRGPEATLADADLRTALLSRPEMRRALARMWPVLTPQRLLSDLYRSPALLASACRGVLGDNERDRLRRDTDDDAWSEHDVALLDEAEELLGERPRRKRAARDSGVDPDASAAFESMVERTMADGEYTPRCLECESELTFVARPEAAAEPWRCPHPGCEATFASSQVMTPEAEVRFHELRTTLGAHAESPPVPTSGRRTYGHVLVDEAQDVSPMQWRMLARRCPSRSMTIVGDLGQASKPWPPGSWETVTTLLGGDNGHAVRTAELSVNYRTPSEVMDVASAVLAAGGAEMAPPRSVRSVGVVPRAVRTTPARRPGTVRRVVGEEQRAVGEGKVAVIAPNDLVDELRSALDAGDDLDASIVVLALDDAKGLEFDAVVILEPASVVAESDQGLRALYVALTRTTTRLALVHTDPLPEPVAANMRQDSGT